MILTNPGEGSGSCRARGSGIGARYRAGGVAGALARAQSFANGMRLCWASAALYATATPSIQSTSSVVPQSCEVGREER